jgi:hypothetical protein
LQSIEQTLKKTTIEPPQRRFWSAFAGHQETSALAKATGESDGNREDRIRTCAENADNSSGSAPSGAESGALGAPEAPLDPNLAAVVEAWPKLREPIKAGILAMIRATE